MVHVNNLMLRSWRRSTRFDVIVSKKFFDNVQVCRIHQTDLTAKCFFGMHGAMELGVGKFAGNVATMQLREYSTHCTNKPFECVCIKSPCTCMVDSDHIFNVAFRSFLETSDKKSRDFVIDISAIPANYPWSVYTPVKWFFEILASVLPVLLGFR